jgi:hypothetical protein
VSTSANVIIISPDNKVDQFYHHWDGYLSGVGEELRKWLLYSIGINALIKDKSVYDILLGELSDCDGYESEGSWELDDRNCIHSDVEFVYVIRNGELFYVNEYDLYNKIGTYRNLVGYICKESNKVNVMNHLTDEDD